MKTTLTALLAKAATLVPVMLAVVLLSVQAMAQTSAQPQSGMQRTSAGAATASQSQTAALQNAEGYRLGSGDRVRITIFGQPELTGEYSVDGGGQMSFPLVGQIRAGGLTAPELEKALTEKLSPGYLKNPSISVEVLTYRPFYIVGEVRTPGSYPFVNGMTVLNAVALAGGFTYRARENSFYVTRTGEDGSKTKLSTGADATILPGDIITVRERYF